MPGSVKKTTQRRVTRRLMVIKDSAISSQQKLKENEIKFLGKWSEEENKWEIWNLIVYHGSNSKLQTSKGVCVFRSGSLLCLFSCSAVWACITVSASMRKADPGSGSHAVGTQSGCWVSESCECVGNTSVGGSHVASRICAPGCSCQLGSYLFHHRYQKCGTAVF